MAEVTASISEIIKLSNDSVQIERDRVLRILQAAREGKIDNDLRSIIHRVESGDDLDM